MGTANADNTGVVTKKSAHSAKVTIDRLEKILSEKGITVAMRWSHSDRAKGVDIELRPTELIIFGNPRLGSHMFTSKQSAGIDLPMKALAWEDENGQTWLSYNDPAYIAKRHGINDRSEIVKKMTGALQNLTDQATSP
ncbi:MAG: DUF302 domain-containing protein [Gammaproteobacteria bacterium]